MLLGYVSILQLELTSPVRQFHCPKHRRRLYQLDESVLVLNRRPQDHQLLLQALHESFDLLRCWLLGTSHVFERTEPKNHPDVLKVADVDRHLRCIQLKYLSQPRVEFVIIGRYSVQHFAFGDFGGELEDDAAGCRFKQQRYVGRFGNEFWDGIVSAFSARFLALGKNYGFVILTDTLCWWISKAKLILTKTLTCR